MSAVALESGLYAMVFVTVLNLNLNTFTLDLSSQFLCNKSYLVKLKLPGCQQDAPSVFCKSLSKRHHS
jgi:hypothetical protein